MAWKELLLDYEMQDWKKNYQAFQTPSRVKLEALIAFSFPYVSDSPNPTGDTWADELAVLDTSLLIQRVNTRVQKDLFLHSLCPSDINSPLQLFLAIILKVHQLGFSKHKPTSFPVTA